MTPLEFWCLKAECMHLAHIWDQPISDGYSQLKVTLVYEEYSLLSKSTKLIQDVTTKHILYKLCKQID